MSYKKIIEEESVKRKEAARKLLLMDANMWLGQGKEFPLAPELRPGDLREVFDTYDITGGCVSHWKALNLSPQEANEALVRAEPTLPSNTYTIWTGLPLLPREQDPLPGYGGPQGNMRGVRIFPKSHRYECVSWVLGDLCSWCVEYNVPLFIWHVEGDWKGLYDIAKLFPDLVLIIESQWQKILYHNRTLYNLMRDCPNVLLEISNFAGQDFVAHGVRTFGSRRFIFGSFLPMNDPYVPLGMLMDAEIEEEEKRHIAGENLTSILEGVRK